MFDGAGDAHAPSRAARDGSDVEYVNRWNHRRFLLLFSGAKFISKSLAPSIAIQGRTPSSGRSVTSQARGQSVFSRTRSKLRRDGLFRKKLGQTILEGEVRRERLHTTRQTSTGTCNFVTGGTENEPEKATVIVTVVTTVNQKKNIKIKLKTHLEGFNFSRVSDKSTYNTRL